MCRRGHRFVTLVLHLNCLQSVSQISHVARTTCPSARSKSDFLGRRSSSSSPWPLSTPTPSKCQFFPSSLFLCSRIATYNTQSCVVCLSWLPVGFTSPRPTLAQALYLCTVGQCSRFPTSASSPPSGTLSPPASVSASQLAAVFLRIH